MPREVTCPSCRHRLNVTAAATEKWLTCPHCLASIGNPNVLVTTEAPAGPAAEALAVSRSCPKCERPVEAGWRFCPYCEEELKHPRAASSASSLEGDVRRDTKGTSPAIVVLGVLLFLGIIIFFGMGGPNLLALGKGSGEVVAVGVMVLVLVLIGSAVIVVGSRSKTASPASGVVGGFFVGAGIVGLIGLLACLAAVAALNNFLNTVCTCGNPPHH